jgi:hypothetical protein
MKNTIITALAIVGCSLSVKAQTIAAARAATVGSNVTFKGIIISGSELGSIRYMQDATAGISIYGTNLSGVNRGDSIIVNGTLTCYNALLEVTPVTYTVLGTNRPLPAPMIIAANAVNEPKEGELVQINNATFAAAGGNFAGNTNYTVTAAGQTGIIRVATTSTLVGTIIPNTPVNLVGIASQFCSSSCTCTTGYQVILRDGNDIINTSSIYLTVQPTISNITTSGFNLAWTTNIAGSSSYVVYSKSPTLASGNTTLVATTSATSHTAIITGAMPATVYYANVYSRNGTDTAKSGIKAYATKSNSSGTIKCYFNRNVDNTVSTGTNAVYLNGVVADTLIAYINRAKSELEIAIYNWDNSSGITAAVNAAGARGVKVRIVYDGSTAQSGLTALSTTNIKWVASPQGANYTIMHNKFVIVDANTNNPNDAILWTGSTNWTSNQLTTDANNVIIFQDQSIARGYKVEFDEMWGDTSVISNANTLVGRFGQFKKNNTPHEYIIGGKRVEQYFSPSDNTNSAILATIGTANSDLHTSNMLITRTDLAQKIASQTTTNSLATKVLLDDSTGYGTQYYYMSSGVGASNIAVDCHSWILHHKYLIVDQSNTASDPLVETGSHNWSTAGDTKNDENTVVVHDAAIANQYYQEFNQRWTERACGTAGIIENTNNTMSLNLYPNPTNGDFLVSYTLVNTDKVSISIYDFMGKKIDSKLVNGILGLNTISISGNEYAKGIYLIEITTGNKKETKKLIVN